MRKVKGSGSSDQPCLIRLKCGFCKTDVVTPQRKRVRKYCSISCASKARGQWLELTCAECGVHFSRRRCAHKNPSTNLSFCSVKCRCRSSAGGKLAPFRPSNFKDGSYIDYRLKTSTWQCVGCCEKRKFILVVHHIDGDRTNNGEANLEVVCLNCHALRHLKLIDGCWRYDTKSLTPRDLIEDLKEVS